MNKYRVLTPILIFLLNLATIACNNEDAPEPQNLTQLPTQKISHEERIQQFLDNLETKLIQVSENQSTNEQNLNLEELAKQLKLAHPKLTIELHPQLINFYYDDLGNPTPNAQKIITSIENADQHALDPQNYNLQKIQKNAEQLQSLILKTQNNEGFWINDREKQALAKYIQQQNFNIHKPKAAEEFIEKITSNEKTSPIPRLACALILQREYKIKQKQKRLELELLTIDAILKFAHDLKFSNLEHFSPEEWEKYANETSPNDMHPRYFNDIIHQRLLNFASQWIQNPQKFDEIWDKLPPQHEQYPKLQQARDKYRQLVENGGWNPVTPDRMFKNGRAPLVKNLKERLQAENYYEGEIDDNYDDALVKAVELYQTTHQLELTGEPNEAFWKSLNIPAQKRLEEIEANIRRWHKTTFEQTDSFIYINVPDFTAQLWIDNKLISSHKVVVGASSKVCNTRTRKWEFINSTPLIRAKMTYLVFNPFWNVPPRIEIDEYHKKINENPKWLENSDFEFHTPKGGGRILRQKPGPNNALGKVKLIFPNKHNIYLHDTPKQGMFQYPIRAFSHGCLRVENAMKLAQAILEHDNQWNKKEIDGIFKKQRKTEHPVNLNKPIDIFIEYHTVKVDENNKIYFLADVYKFIKNEITPPSALDISCDPAKDKTSNFRSMPMVDEGP